MRDLDWSDVVADGQRMHEEHLERVASGLIETVLDMIKEVDMDPVDFIARMIGHLAEDEAGRAGIEVYTLRDKDLNLIDFTITPNDMED